MSDWKSIYAIEAYETYLTDSRYNEYIEWRYRIVFNNNHEQASKRAYDKIFRTEEGARRAAKRLYNRTFGAFEVAVNGTI